MEEDSDTRSSFPSPFKQDVANGSACTPETDIMSFRKCLDMETNAPFLQNGKVQLLFFKRLMVFVTVIYLCYTIGRDLT